MPGDAIQKVYGGSGRNRTGVHGVAVRCMTTLPPSHIWGIGAGNGRGGAPLRTPKTFNALLDTLRIGAGNRVRTGDLNLGKVALYQLSYSRTSLRVTTAVVAGTVEAARPATTMARLRSTN